MASSFICSASRTRITPTSFGSRASARCQSANKIRHPHFLPCSTHSQLLSFLDNKALRRHCFDERVEETAKKHEVEAVEFVEKIKEVGENEEDVETENDGLASALTEESTGIVEQMKGILKFAGPAVGIWACGPLMSLIDTAVVGQVSSMELAALGPATVLCDVTGYMFMFLSIATSNMVATSLAEKDEGKMQSQFSTLLFIALFCGFTLLILTKAFGMHLLKAFVGSKNAQIIPAANSYIQIRGLAWPAVLVGMVAQSASLGMKDSWSPLKVLMVASLINGMGDIVLCNYLGYGIAGAAFATAVSEVVAACMMLASVFMKGPTAPMLSFPSLGTVKEIVELAAPVFLTLVFKISFYLLLTYSTTTIGYTMLAAHQVMVGIHRMCNVWGEPLSQTAQAFMPAFIYGVQRNLRKAQKLIQSLLMIGAVAGVILGSVGVFVELFLPQIFTRDSAVISEMHGLTLPLFLSVMVTPATSSMEGSLLAGRDLKYLSCVMSYCFFFCSIFLLIATKKELGLQACWWSLVCFNWSRLLAVYLRVNSPNSPTSAATL